MRIILHIDFNSYFATVEQQANPRLRGKPIGVTGGDRLERTVLGAASVEAKKLGVKTGMSLQEAKRVCPQLILVRGDSDKYLSTTKQFLNILKSYSSFLEVFSIDEAFLELPQPVILGSPPRRTTPESDSGCGLRPYQNDIVWDEAIMIARQIKQRIKLEIGEWITCSIGISYNKMLAKLAGSLYKQSLRMNLNPELERFILKPDGLVAITDPIAAQFILDRVGLDEICGLGPRIKKRLNNMGVFDFKTLRKVPKENLIVSFKSYGEVLYDFARGEDFIPVLPFYEKEEIKSAGHRHTFYKDTKDPEEIKQVLLKITELIARKMRSKGLLGKTVSFWYRSSDFSGSGIQTTIYYTNDGLEIFEAAWKIFWNIWDKQTLRMIGASLSNLKPQRPQNLSFLAEEHKKEVITQAIDKINDKYGEFTLQRGVLLGSDKVKRKPNPYLSDYRFKW